MEITLKNQDATSARLVVNIQEADYSALVEKQLKNFRQKANVPGFRPGMVPMGLIKKQYGVAVKAEEINKLLQSKIFEYMVSGNPVLSTRIKGIPDEYFDYIIPLDSPSIREHRFDDNFYEHQHIPLPLATLAKLDDLDENMRKNYLAFVEWLKANRNK